MELSSWRKKSFNEILNDESSGTKTLILRHGDYFSVYWDLKNISVKESDLIKENQKLGELKERDDEYLLNFQIWKETNTLNPMEWIVLEN